MFICITTVIFDGAGLGQIYPFRGDSHDSRASYGNVPAVLPLWKLCAAGRNVRRGRREVHYVALSVPRTMFGTPLACVHLKIQKSSTHFHMYVFITHAVHLFLPREDHLDVRSVL